MDDDDKLSLRDKFAIEILHAMIARIPLKEYDDELNFFVNNWDFKGQPDLAKFSCEKVEKLVRAAYKIADIMREVRLTAFK